MVIVLITGATAGFGLSFAKRFIDQGHKVIATGRRKERLEALQKQYPDSLYPLVLDITDRGQVETIFTKLPKEWHNIDVLINNAGLALGLELSQNADLSDWETVIDTNNKGLLYMTRTILPQMLKQKRGHIINIGSVAGSWPYQGGNVYGASKAFVKQFSLNLRTDLHGTPIRVTNIEPGIVKDTEFSYVRFHGDEEKVKQTYAGTNALKPEDIAESVYWVATLPAHMNINSMEIMPVSQSFAGLMISKV